jgi:tRNA pseudouridine38-40 synthase
VRLDFAYDGGGFSGWAAQPGRRTVEAELATALARVLRLDDAPRLTVAGRTDAGVHARGAVAHLDLPWAAWSALPGRSAMTSEVAAGRRLNAVLPADLVVRRATVAPPGFDARFSALSRRYVYRLCDDLAAWDPLRRHDTVLARRPLDEAAMSAASGRLLGLRDFAAYCRRREGASTVRTLMRYGWTRASEGVLEAAVEADAFCHHMVRALVGAAVAVGEGRREVGWPAEVLAAGRKDPAVTVAPAHGLTLEEVRYPPAEGLAARAAEARARR